MTSVLVYKDNIRVSSDITEDAFYKTMRTILGAYSDVYGINVDETSNGMRIYVGEGPVKDRIMYSLKDISHKWPGDIEIKRMA